MDDRIGDSGWLPIATTNELRIDYGWSPSCEIFSTQIKCIICDADNDNIICSKCKSAIRHYILERRFEEMIGE